MCIIFRQLHTASSLFLISTQSWNATSCSCYKEASSLISCSNKHLTNMSAQTFHLKSVLLQNTKYLVDRKREFLSIQVTSLLIKMNAINVVLLTILICACVCVVSGWTETVSELGPGH